MKISAEGGEVVLRMTAEEAIEIASGHWGHQIVDDQEHRLEGALRGTPVSALVALGKAAREVASASGAGEYLRAERFDRRVEEGQIDAARLAFEAEREQARKDYGFTDEPSPADAAQELTDRRYPDREGRVEGVDR